MMWKSSVEIQQEISPEDLIAKQISKVELGLEATTPHAMFAIVSHDYISTKELPDIKDKIEALKKVGTGVHDKVLVDGGVYLLHLGKGNLSIRLDGQKDISVLCMKDYQVVIYPPELPVADMYNRKQPLLIKSLVPISDKTSSEFGLYKQLFLWFADSSIKEDWYLSLKLRVATVDRMHYAESLAYDRKKAEIAWKTINIQDQTTGWFNILAHRLFMSVSREKDFQEYAFEQIQRKFDHIALPDFVGPVKVSSVQVGDFPPTVSNAKVIRFEKDGSAELLLDVAYHGAFKTTIQTELQTEGLNIPLLPSLSLQIQLDAELTKMRGQLKVIIKPAPSNGVWFGFTSPPVLEMSLTPLMNLERQVSLDYKVITDQLENKIKEAINEELVLPQMAFADIPGNNASFDSIFRRGNSHGLQSLLAHTTKALAKQNAEVKPAKLLHSIDSQRFEVRK